MSEETELPMDEAEWLTSEDPDRMYRATRNTRWGHPPRAVWTERRGSLFGAACSRLFWPLVVLDERCRRVVEYNEKRFDKPLSARSAEALYWNGKQAAEDPTNEETPFLLEAANLVYDSGYPGLILPRLLTSFQTWGDSAGRVRRIADIMREVVGNPFRPTTCSPSWRTDDVLALAKRMYQSRKFSAMPILADALEDAACDDERLLDHCRGPGPHLRGCWALDAILGKE